MRLHSALHLLAGIFDHKFKERAVAGVVKPDSAYLVFKHQISDEILKQAINEANETTQSYVLIKTYLDEKRKGFRWCRVNGFPPIPDGGLHVKSSKEIGTIKIVGTSVEGGKHKIII